MNLLFKHIRWHSEGRDEAGDLRIGHGRMLDAGRGLAPLRRERVVDGSGYLALPGLINAHDHLDLNLFPRLGTPPYPNFYAWGRDIYHPEQSPIRDVLRVSLPDRLRWSAYKNLVSGVTTVVHHNPYHRRLFQKAYPVKVLERYAWSHSLGHSPDVAKAFAQRRGRPYIIHAAEGTDTASSEEIEQLGRLGMLAPGTVLVHAIALSDEQVRTLAERVVGVVWCPSSNLHLYGRTAPVHRLLPQVRVALGTDSTLSGAPTLWDELKTAHATGLATPSQLLEMVTTGAAALFDLGDGRGTLRREAPADVLLLPDTGRSAADTLLAATPASVSLVLVDGVPHLAHPDLANALDLGPPDTFIAGRPRWMTGSLSGLRRRIARTVAADILLDNPLWSLFEAQTNIPALP
ncbi:MAG: amidohydrolase family protein [Rhodothermales bacterium]